MRDIFQGFVQGSWAAVLVIGLVGIPATLVFCLAGNPKEADPVPSPDSCRARISQVAAKHQMRAVRMSCRNTLESTECLVSWGRGPTRNVAAVECMGQHLFWKSRN